jgi:hypothetical protein
LCHRKRELFIFAEKIAMKRCKIFWGLFLGTFIVAKAQPSYYPLVYNEGAFITIQSGALVYVQGGLQNRDVGANQGRIDNAGTLRLLTTLPGNYEGDFQNIQGAEFYLLSGGTIYVADDWNNDATFTAQSGTTVHFIGADNQYFTKGSNANSAGMGDRFYDVVINNTGSGDDGVEVWGAGVEFVVENQLNLSAGIMKTAANNEVRVLNPALAGIVGYTNPPSVLDDRYIAGRLRRVLPTSAATVYFPVGALPSGKQYQLIQFTFNGNPNIHNLLVYFTPSAVGSVGPFDECGASFDNALDNGYWTANGYSSDYVTTDNSTNGTTYTVTLHNRNYTNPGAPQYTNAKNPGGGWGLYGTSCTGSTNPDLVPRDGITDFSRFVTVYSMTPFPVEDLFLTAKPKVSSILLQWHTTQEVNNAGFELQRSLDGTHFVALTWVEGNGTTYDPHDYAYEDNAVQFNTKYYYRLKQVDFDGTFTYSNVVEAILVKQNETTIAIYPNPTSNTLHMMISTTKSQPIEVILYDVAGKRLASNVYQVEKGAQTLDLSSLVQTLAVGTYYLQIHTENEQFIHHLVVTQH